MRTVVAFFASFALLLPSGVTCTPISQVKRQDAAPRAGEVKVTGWAGIAIAGGATLQQPASVTAFIPYTGASYSGGPNTTIYAYYEITLTASGESATVVETHNATNVLVIGPTALSQAVYYGNAENHTVANYNECAVNASHVGVCDVQVVVGTYTIPAASYTTQGALIEYPATPTSIVIPSSVTDIIGVAQIMAPTAVPPPASAGSPIGGAAALPSSASSPSSVGRKVAVSGLPCLMLCALLSVHLL